MDDKICPPARTRSKERSNERTKEGTGNEFTVCARATAAPPFGAKNEQWVDLMLKSDRDARRTILFNTCLSTKLKEG